MKAATKLSYLAIRGEGISIHAAREGGDAGFLRVCRQRRPISIHAAREGGDAKSYEAWQELCISIHAAREGGDRVAVCKKHIRNYFNPRRP